MSGGDDDRLRHARARWRYRGGERPPFALPTVGGQESVWDYPRPPIVVPDPRHVTIHADGLVIADTQRALRVLETGSPPTFYLPWDDVDTTHLVAARNSTLCEWKGVASYWTLDLPGRRLEGVAWSYPEPYPGFEALRDGVAFYPESLDCFVDGAPVRGQPGRYYGGWVTGEVVGPFKGEPGTGNW